MINRGKEERKEENLNISAIAIISGTTIGAGYLGLPYVISKPGFLIGLAYLIILGIVTLFFKLCLGEVILRTSTKQQLAGYAEKYLGKKGKYIMFLSMAIGIYSALIAYLIAEGESLSYLFFGNFNYFLLFSIAFWIILAFVSYIGTEALKRFDKIGLAFVGLFLLILFFSSIKFIRSENLSNLNFSFNNLFLPIGVVLFSFIGFSSIPEARKILYKNEGKLKSSIIIGMIIPLAFYILFTFIIIGRFGQGINEIATLNLARIFSLIAIITIFNSSFSQTIAIRDMFRYDFGLSRFFAWCLACFIPLISFFIINLFQLASFIELLSFSGVVSSGIAIILIFFMKEKANELGDRKPEYSMKSHRILLFLALIILLAGVYSAAAG
jgi:tyrosine-specific transport protein